jgi:O-antigen/teichoic acid export membrane protein
VTGGDGVVRARVVRGSMILLTSTGAVAATNLLYNIVVARMLGAAGFGHATAIYTLLMLASSVTLSFQLVCSKLVAKSDGLAAKAGVYRGLLRRAWQIGIGVGLVLAFQSQWITSFLKLPAAHDIDLLAIAAAVYIPLGVQRGRMQGCYEFRRLAINVIVEATTKLGVAVLLLYYGLGVTGVITGITLSIVAAYFVAIPDREFRLVEARAEAASFGEGLQAGVFFIGQVIISNLDILLVKHYFAPTLAGIYAGVALVGRVVYMLSWSVVSSMFPASASSSHEKAGQFVLRTALLLVVALTGAFVFLVWVAPGTLWALILGKQFLFPMQASFSSLLTLYAGMTAIYSIAVVLMTYEMSRRIGHVGWVQFATSVLLAVGIALFHGSLAQVIQVQLVLMAGLLVVVSAPLWTRAEAEPLASVQAGKLRKLHRVAEEEVIAEFLKGEFYHREFDRYRDQFQDLVERPALTSPYENRLRRALLFRRRGKLWRELPPDTEWWEIALDREAMARVRAFPRDDWRRFAKGEFYLGGVIARIEERLALPQPDQFLEKLRSMEADLLENRVPNSVVLIGQDEASPLTLIEGNHRMAAAMLLDGDLAYQRFRYYCGFSARMKSCCWYQTDLSSLWRYACNRLLYVFHDSDYSVARAFRDVQVDPKVELGD